MEIWQILLSAYLVLGWFIAFEELTLWSDYDYYRADFLTNPTMLFWTTMLFWPLWVVFGTIRWFLVAIAAAAIIPSIMWRKYKIERALKAYRKTLPHGYSDSFWGN